MVGHELGRVESAEDRPDLLRLPGLPKVLRLRRRQPSSQPGQTVACGLELDARGGCTGYQECQLPAARYAPIQTAQQLLRQRIVKRIAACHTVAHTVMKHHSAHSLKRNATWQLTLLLYLVSVLQLQTLPHVVAD